MSSTLDEILQILLSGNAGLIRRVWNNLTDDEAKAVADRLQRVIADDGYTPEQKVSAQNALNAIREAG